MSEIQVPFGNMKLNYNFHKAAIDEAVTRVLEKGWFVLGQEGRLFEESFASYCGQAYGIGVGSGTEALHLALLACGVKSGDEVITVANTCVPTVSAISFAGAIPVFVDIDQSTYTMDPSRIEERITPITKVIIPVHLYGQCTDMYPILEIAKKYGLKVIEDCAQAHGAKYRGQVAGTMGDAGAYSFYPSKNLGAYGDAGIVVTGDPAIAEYVRMARNYGEKQRYNHAIKGFNSRLDEIQAAILMTRLPFLDKGNQRRRQIAARYSEAFQDIDGIDCPAEAEGRYHVYHLYVIRVRDRKRFQEIMAEHGVATMIHYPVPIHRQESYLECSNQASYLKSTDSIAPHIVSLPIYPEMTDEQVNVVITAVKVFFGQ